VIKQAESENMATDTIRQEVKIGSSTELGNWPVGHLRILAYAPSVDGSNTEIATPLGSAFIINVRNQQTLCLTKHQYDYIVMADKATPGGVWIHGPNGQVPFDVKAFSLTFIGKDQQSDVALLKIPQTVASVTGAKALPLLTSYNERMIAQVSRYEDGKWFCAFGIATIPARSGEITHNCSTIEGTSGSPLLVQSQNAWRVVGVHTGGRVALTKVVGSEKISYPAENYAVPLGWFGIRSVAEWRNRKKSETSPPRGLYPFELDHESSLYESIIDDSYDSENDKYVIEEDDMRERRRFEQGEEDVFIPRQDLYDSEEDRELQDAVEDYARDPTGAGMARIKRLHKAHATQNETSFPKSPVGAGADSHATKALPRIPEYKKSEIADLVQQHLNQVSRPPNKPVPALPVEVAQTEILQAFQQEVSKVVQAELLKVSQTINSAVKIPQNKSAASKLDDSEKPLPTKEKAKQRGKPNPSSSKRQKQQEAGSAKPSKAGAGQKGEPKRK